MAEPRRPPPNRNAPDHEQGVVDAEVMRSAEQERVRAERLREGSEADRRMLEADRIDSEERREQHESLRAEAELARAVAEEARRIAEEARELAELARRETSDLRDQVREQDELMLEMRAAMRALVSRDELRDR